MDARNEMLDRLQRRRPGYSLEQAFYTDTEYYRLDLELICYRHRLFIGHDCELPKPGSYFTVQIGDDPVVLVRDFKEDDPRLSQHLPPSRLPRLHGGKGQWRQISGEVEMDHNGGILDHKIGEGYILACRSRPLGPVTVEA